MPPAPAQFDAFAFQGPGRATSAITAGAVNAAGQPTKRFCKDLIRVGRFTGGGGSYQSFEVTLDDHDPANGKFSLQHFRDQFTAMRLAGIDVPTPNGHTNDAEANRGYVRYMFIEGDTLYGTIEAIGNDAIQLMSRAKVSINVPVALQAGNGKTYDYPIDHVAIVTNPVIPDQNGFVALAASRSATHPDKAQALVLSPETAPMETPTNPPEPTGDDKPKVTDLATLAAALGIEIAEGQEAGPALVAAITAIKSERDTLKQKVQEQANQPAPSDVMVAASLDPNVADALIENNSLKLSRLVEDGKITPAVCDALKSAFVGTAEQPRALTLSRGKKGEPSVIAQVVEILGKNDPVKLKEATKSQSAIAASRQAVKDDPDLTKAMTEQASGATAGVAL